MHLAASPIFRGDVEIAKLLAAHSAKCDLLTQPQKDTPLLAAVRAGNLPMIQWLLEKGKDIDRDRHERDRDREIE